MARDGSQSARHFHGLATRYLAVATFDFLGAISEGGSPEGLTNAATQNAAMAVECALKALMLFTANRGRHEAILASFTGAKAHDFEWLKNRLVNGGISLPKFVISSISRMSWWTHDQRYVLKIVSKAEASKFLEDARRVVEWVEGGISS